jgi:hypothetical protein
MDTTQVDNLLAYARKENLKFEISDFNDKSAIYNKERERLAKDFLLFAENNSISDPNFTFNREECYAR